jgi:elongation factor Ts
MSAISASMVKELRERTGAGMMECKKALVATEGNIEEAIEELRRSGVVKAAKKAGRIAAEGVVAVNAATDGKHAVILEINSETDFVSRDENFLNFVEQVTTLALQNRIQDVDSLMQATLEGKTVDEVRQALVAKIGENVSIRRLTLVTAQGTLGCYSHGGRIGVVVDCVGGDASLAKDLAMHIAASNPVAIKPEDVPADVVAKEKEIAQAQAETSGKPAEIIEKMVMGRVNKYLNEVSLLGQAFVKDTNLTVEKLLKQHQAEVVSFTRYEVGEGIEKEEVNFAEEVMAQARQ